MIYFHSNIKYLREKNGYSINQAERYLNLAHGLGSHYERDIIPQHDTLVALADFYKTSIHELCFCDLQNNSTESISFKKEKIDFYTKEEIYSSFQSQPEKMQKHILQLLGLR